MLLEAQASMVPVVAFDVGGVGEAVRNGETGFLAKLGDTEEFADAIMRLLSDGALRTKIGSAGRRFVMENYTWELVRSKDARRFIMKRLELERSLISPAL